MAQLPREGVTYRGVEHDHAISLYGVWLAQRSQGYYQSLPADAKTEVDDMLGSGVLFDLVSVPLQEKDSRQENRLFISGRQVSPALE